MGAHVARAGDRWYSAYPEAPGANVGRLARNNGRSAYHRTIERDIKKNDADAPPIAFSSPESAQPPQIPSEGSQADPLRLCASHFCSDAIDTGAGDDIQGVTVFIAPRHIGHSLRDRNCSEVLSRR